jgi:hypothetical protein
MNNIGLNDNWCISVLIFVVIILLLVKIYEVFGYSEIKSSGIKSSGTIIRTENLM